jgi:hypothetical protein
MSFSLGFGRFDAAQGIGASRSTGRIGEPTRMECSTAMLGVRPHASAEVTVDQMTGVSRDRIAMSQAPITPRRRNIE